MKFLLSGGTGFLGHALSAALAAQGHEVVVLTRGPSVRTAIGRWVTWHPTGTVGPAANWPAEVDGADVIINLAGEGIADRRWTDRRKEVLRQSRILSTRSLVAAVRAVRRRPAVFISASGVGYYGNTGDEPIDESFPPGSDFLATLSVDWEAEAHAAAALGCRVVIVRTGIVLAPEGGALKEILRPFKFFAGGPMASGRQYVSWIHRDDWVAMTEWATERADLAGPINATAPHPVTNQELARAIGRAIGRPSWLRVPRLALRMIVGEMADVALVNGQRVLPGRALDAGFRFKYETIDAALAAAL